MLLGQDNSSSYFSWEKLTELPKVGAQNEALGVAGPISGISNDALIVAGGANFDKPYWESTKQWHNDIWVLPKISEGNKDWLFAGKLGDSLAYSAVVTTKLGVIAMGGTNGVEVTNQTILFKWDERNQIITQEVLPSLPKPCVYGSATLLGDKLYLAGGTEGLELASSMNNFWVLDLNNYGNDKFKWEILPTWPGPSRAFNITVNQHNGYNGCIYVMSGRREANSSKDWEVLNDMYEFDPEKFKNNEQPWRQRKSLPMPRMAGTGIAVGQGHIFILSGADGSLYKEADMLKDNHPGFPKNILAYHTITDIWFNAGKMPLNHVTTHAFHLNDEYYIASGEIKPRIRTPTIWRIKAIRTASSFGWVNITAIIIYLLVLVGVGIFFSFRNKNTEDFFRGGQRIPWWAAGCSIFATMLSSLTFMSVPAKTYATDWLYFFINMAIIALAPFIIYYILPFFRKIDATSAYQYLEMRFNLATRLFASASYMLFQIGRMAIVMYLPSLALATVTPISIEMSILIMGLLSILYCTLGGVEAVIWTDTIQTFVLLGGAFLSLLLVLLNPDIGFSEFINVAATDNKFEIVDTGWSYMGTALWVVILGGLGQSLVPYTSDQGVVQRYMSVSTEKKASQSIWANAALSLLATLLFFSVGTALYVFYKKNPTLLDPTYQTDAVFPIFISRQLPVGIAGIVIAGIFAAAQSTISTSMNSIATAFTTDFIRRFDLLKNESSYLKLARVVTLVFGILGTLSALLIAYADVKSLWDSFISILGLLGGSMCGLFLLGIFTLRASGKGAISGAVLGAISLWLVQQYTAVSFLLYALVGISMTFSIGYLVSLLLPKDKKSIDGLTIFTLRKT